MNRLSSINSVEAPVGKTPTEKPVISTASQQLDDLMASLHDFHVNVNNTRVRCKIYKNSVNCANTLKVKTFIIQNIVIYMNFINTGVFIVKQCKYTYN